MKPYRNIARLLRRCETGATAVEYGLIVAIIAVGALIAIINVADSNTSNWEGLANDVTEASE